MYSPKLKFDPSARILGHLDLEEPIAIESHALVSRSTLGAYSFVGKGTEVWNASIGRYCSIGPGCRIGPGDHPMDRITTSSISYSDYFAFYADNTAIVTEYETREPVTIGHDVWIGASSIVTNGVTIGDGAIIAANAVVTKDIPPFAVVGGVPAKVIRNRFDDRTTERMKQLSWWRYDLPLWGQRGDLPRLSTITEQSLDAMERAVTGQPPPRISGRRYRVTFNGSSPLINPLAD